MRSPQTLFKIVLWQIFPNDSSHICFSHAFLSFFLSSVTSFLKNLFWQLIFSFCLLSINRLILTRSFIFKSLSLYLLFSIARRETSTLKDYEIVVVVIVVVLVALLICTILLFSTEARETSTWTWEKCVTIGVVVLVIFVVAFLICWYVVFPSHFWLDFLDFREFSSSALLPSPPLPSVFIFSRQRRKPRCLIWCNAFHSSHRANQEVEKVFPIQSSIGQVSHATI